MNDGQIVLTYKPGDGDDLFRGLSDGTLSTSDIINGGGGTDTLQFGVTANTTGTIVRAPSLTSVEFVKATMTGAGNGTDATFSGVNSTGIEQVWSLNSVGSTSATAGHNSTLIVNNVGKAVVAGIQGGLIGNTTANTYASLTVSYNDVTGSADASTLKMNLGKANNVTIAGVETLTIDSTGKKTATDTGNTIAALAADKLATLNLKGDGDVVITDTHTGSTLLRTVNATDATGNLTLDVALGGDMKVTGGHGNDKFLFAATLNTNDVVNGGDGDDTLSANITQLAAFTTTAANISSIKTVEVADAAGTTNLNISRFGADSISFASTVGAATITGLASGSNVTFADTPSAVVLSLTGADSSQTDVLNVGTNKNTDTTYTFTANNVETLNVSAPDTVAGTSTATLVVTDPQLKEINLTAKDANFTINSNTSGNTVVSTVDASGLTNGILTYTGSATAVNGTTITGTGHNDVIVGTSQGDTIHVGAGNDSVTGSGGNDTIDLTGGGANTAIFASTGAGNGKDTITGFNTGTAAGADVLDVDAFIGTVPGTLTTIGNLTSAATIANDSINIVNFNAAIAGKDFAGGDFGDLFGAGKVFSTTIADNAVSVLVIQGTDQTQIIYVNEAIDNSPDLTVEVGDVAIVGVLTDVTNAATFNIANFS
ncbi:calcium-binding protein [Allochromatium humboldtianum]|uniref:Calcium-binding protein n=1 Tax=Allochromatium humboldtianum TaxID=504901 RepID=A0A850R867_9GAMM|nr:calcium-binding protein [Allochromatium humboldtianum]NVZ10044.1 calcium-binding protein [Allochromatium humboldtianum]